MPFFLPFTTVNLPFDLQLLLWSSNVGKKVANTAVHGKLPLTIGNPSCSEFGKNTISLEHPVYIRVLSIIQK